MFGTTDPELVEKTIEDEIKEHNNKIEKFCRGLMEFVTDNWPNNPWMRDMGRGDGCLQKIKDCCSQLRTLKCHAACPVCDGAACNKCYQTGMVPKHTHDRLA